MYVWYGHFLRCVLACARWITQFFEYKERVCEECCRRRSHVPIDFRGSRLLAGTPLRYLQEDLLLFRKYTFRKCEWNTRCICVMYIYILYIYVKMYTITKIKYMLPLHFQQEGKYFFHSFGFFVFFIAFFLYYQSRSQRRC